MLSARNLREDERVNSLIQLSIDFQSGNHMYVTMYRKELAKILSLLIYQRLRVLLLLITLIRSVNEAHGVVLKTDKFLT